MAMMRSMLWRICPAVSASARSLRFAIFARCIQIMASIVGSLRFFAGIGFYLLSLFDIVLSQVTLISAVFLRPLLAGPLWIVPDAENVPSGFINPHFAAWDFRFRRASFRLPGSLSARRTFARIVTSD